MSVLIISHPSGLAHDTGPEHPERIDRLRAVLARLAEPDFADWPRLQAPAATIEQIARVHDRGYVETVLARIPQSGLRHLDGDTVVCPSSGIAALHAAGAAIAGVDAVMSGEAATAFCAMRPPGHHAEPDMAMGFCLFNNVAVGAAHALAVHGLERVAIVDFDVHHGNGTQSMAEAEPRFMYVSLHEYPLYPGTGRPDETGRHGNILNAIMREGSGCAEFRHAFERVIVPALDRFMPQLLMISAGFDAHENDPLAGLQLSDADYAWMTDALLQVARRHAAGRVVSVLEGGYDLAALRGGVSAHLKALAGQVDAVADLDCGV